MRALIFIGEMGSGKSFVAERLAEQAGAGVTYIEGDDFAGPEMAEAISSFKIISNEMVDDLVVRLADHIASLPRTENVIVAQALYRERHRQLLVALLESIGIETKVVWVRVGFWQHVRQLLSRPKGWRWLLYWLISKPFFQKPVGGDIYVNDHPLSLTSGEVHAG